MSLLKREYTWVWVLAFLSTFGLASPILGSMMHVYSKDAWYAKKNNWIIASICFLYPVLVMGLVFVVESLSLIAEALEVPGREIYKNPYSYLLCMIIPVFGWIFLIVMILYMMIEILIQFGKGRAETYM